MEVRFALLAALLLSCAPSQHDPNAQPITVAFGPSIGVTPLVWRDDQFAELRTELRALAALGPSFVEASEGVAAYVVRPFDSGPGCPLGAARWTPGTAFVEVDAACCHGFTELRAAVGHELFHAVTGSARHVCLYAGELPDCSPVGYGSALLNPRLSYGDAADPAAQYNDIATSVPTQLDLDEWRRVRP